MKLRPGLRPGRRPFACYHEAGHAVARWWLGFYTDSVSVLSLAEIAAGVRLVNRRGVRADDAEGFCDGYDIYMPFAGPELRDAARQRAEMDMVSSLAGPFSEARYRRRSALACFLEGGNSDLRNVKAMADAYCDDAGEGSAAKARAEKIAAALVRSSPGWKAIGLIAASLFDRGRLDGEEIDAVCEAAFGTDLQHDRWREEWPPSIALIRAGYLPGKATAPA